MTKNRKIKYITTKQYAILGFVVLAAVLLRAGCNWYDMDGYFLLSTGRKIRELGILKTNPFCLVEGMNTIIQQWLYIIPLSFVYDTFGEIGLLLWNMCFAAITYLLVYAVVKNSGAKKLTAYVSGILAIVFMYYDNIRPEWITLDLLFAQVLCVEKYLSTNKKGYLYVLPLLTLLEINVHASYWIMHYVFLMPYLVPALVFKNKIDDAGFKGKQYLDLIVPVILMTASLFVNPYGIDGIMYVFTSLKAGVGDIGIFELNDVEIFSVIGLPILLHLIISSFTILNGKVKSYNLYMILGISLLLITKNKWSVFLPSVTMTLGKEIETAVITYVDSYGYKYKWEKLVKLITKKIPVFFMSAVVIFVAVLVFDGYRSHKAYGMKYSDSLLKIESYIQENGNKEEDAVFASFQYGSYFEFYGFKIMVDARPELYCKEVTGNADVLKDWYKLRNFKSVEGSVLSLKEYEELFNKYDFRYYVFSPTDYQMERYVIEHTDLKLVMNSGKFSLYEKSR